MPCAETHRRQLRRHGSCNRGKQERAGARAETTQDNWEPLAFRLEKEGATMYEFSVYPITPNLWRWEIRGGGALLCCGTTLTRAAAETVVNEIINA